MAKKEYLEAIRKRYLRSDKKEKSKILDEFCSNCNYNRKYAIRKLGQANGLKQYKKKPGKYDKPEILEFLLYMLKATNLICSKRLKSIIPLWIPYYRKSRLTDETKRLLHEISPASIDRILSNHRKKLGKLGLATTKPGSLLKKRIPIKTNQWDETRPGSEADTVAHCGTSVSGSFVYTDNIVDIATGWTEQRACWGKGQRGVHNAIQDIESSLPFRILGFDSEFLNYHILSYFQNSKKPVQYTRSRPYYKNDNAHIEQKNWTHIRQYLGYSRFDNPDILPLLNNLYSNQWRLLFNFFIPSVKLIAKDRIDGKIIKKYDSPKTPFQRLIESGYVKISVLKILKAQYKNLDPFALQKQVRENVIEVLNLANFIG